jgi:hypothetical protein
VLPESLFLIVTDWFLKQAQYNTKKCDIVESGKSSLSFQINLPAPSQDRRFIKRETGKQKVWNYWGFGRCTVPGILKTRKHNVSETVTDPVPETLCFLIFRIADDGQSPKAQ